MARDHICGVLYSKFTDFCLSVHRIVGDPSITSGHETARIYQGFFEVPRADPMRGQMCPKARIGHPRDPRCKNISLPSVFKIFREPSGFLVYLHSAPPTAPLATLPIIKEQGFTWFFMDPRADPIRGHMCPKTRTGHPREPYCRNICFYQWFSRFPGNHQDFCLSAQDSWGGCCKT